MMMSPSKWEIAGGFVNHKLEEPDAVGVCPRIIPLYEPLFLGGDPEADTPPGAYNHRPLSSAMKTLLATRYVTIPEDVTLDVKSRIVTVKGPRGELVQSFKHLNLDIQKSGTDKLRVDLWFGNRKQVCSVGGAFCCKCWWECSSGVQGVVRCCFVAIPSSMEHGVVVALCQQIVATLLAKRVVVFFLAGAVGGAVTRRAARDERVGGSMVHSLSSVSQSDAVSAEALLLFG